tara:strand:+ start:1884 stop:3602 length:1719 start_codon:yes stop_codon:yes gene_type:complete
MNNSLDYFNQINTNNQLVNEQKTEAYQKKQLSLEHLNRISEPLNLVGSEMALGALRGLGGKVIDRVADKTGSNALRSIAEGVRTGKITDIKGVSENLRKQAETAFKNKTGNLNETFDSLSNKASQGVRNAKAVIRDAPNKIQARVKATKQTIEEKAKQGIASNIDDSLPKMTTSGAQTETPKLGLKGGVREPPVLDEERLIYDPNVSGGIKRRKAGGGFQDYKSPESELKRQLDLQKAKLEDTSITPRAAEQRRLRREGKDPDDIDLPRKGEAPPRITTGQEELPKIDFGQQIKETPEEAQARRETDLQKSSKEIGTRGAKGEDEDIKITPRRQRINPATQTEGLDPSTLPEGAGMRGAGGQKIEAARPSSPTLEPLEPSKKVSFGESEIKTFESDKPPSMEEHLQQIKNKKQLRSDFNSLSGEDKLRYSKGTKNLNISSQSDRQNLMSNIKNNPTIEQPKTAPPISTQTEPDPATTPTIATPETPAEPAPAEPAPAEPTPKPTPTEPAPTEKPFEDLGKTAGADAEIGLGDLADPLLGVGLMLIPSLLGSSEDKTTPVPAPISVSNQQGTN